MGFRNLPKKGPKNCTLEPNMRKKSGDFRKKSRNFLKISVYSKFQKVPRFFFEAPIFEKKALFPISKFLFREKRKRLFFRIFFTYRKKQAPGQLKEPIRQPQKGQLIVKKTLKIISFQTNLLLV